MMKSGLLREPACTQESRVIKRRLSKRHPLYTTRNLASLDVTSLLRRKISFFPTAVRYRWLNSYADLRSSVISLFKPGCSDYRERDTRVIFHSRRGYEVTQNRTTGAWKCEVTGIAIFLFRAYAGGKNNEARVGWSLAHVCLVRRERERERDDKNREIKMTSRYKSAADKLRVARGG